MKMIYQLIMQSKRKNVHDEWLITQGTYHECLSNMKHIEKGYIVKFEEGKEFDEKGNFTGEIVRTKGWSNNES